MGKWQHSQRNVHKRLHLTGGSSPVSRHGHGLHMEAGRQALSLPGSLATLATLAHIKAQATRIDAPAPVPATCTSSDYTQNKIYKILLAKFF